MRARGQGATRGLRGQLCFLALLALAAALPACRHYGAGWRAEPVTPEASAIELVVLAQPRAGAETRKVAAEVDRWLARGRDQGRAPTVLWLGNDFGRPGPDAAGDCPGPAALAEQPGLRELGEVIIDHRERGGEAWGLPGPDDWRCGRTGLEARASFQVARQPGLAYLLRFDGEGRARVASSCEGFTCAVDGRGAEDARLELLMIDTSWWHYPELAGDDLEAALLAQQRSLVAALRERPGPPRVLVSAIPVDSAGKHGFGGRLQRTGFHYLPPFLQQALADGLFVGVVGGLERSLQLSADIHPAIVRGDRSFVAAPIFQVVSGAAGGAEHSALTSRANGLLPDLESEHPGFARVVVGERIDLSLHARVAGRWREGRLAVPRDPEPYAPVRDATRILPCHQCDPVEAAADGPIWVPRGERPR